ncbi:MAG: addiction module protein [Syntrophobacteraceae bacterium]
MRLKLALIREIEKQARMLSTEERELLAERLLTMANEAPLTDLDIVWLEEAERRYSLWKTGQTEGIAAEQALSDIRRELQK